MRKKNAYFTVEAALVLPVVMSAMLLGIYLFCYQYDRCLLEQDMGWLLVRGMAVIAENADDARNAEKELQNLAAQIYREKYAAWKFGKVRIGLERNKLSCVGAGELVFPVPGWNFPNQKHRWKAEAGCDADRLSPVFYIRQYRKLHGLPGETS